MIKCKGIQISLWILSLSIGVGLVSSAWAQSKKGGKRQEGDYVIETRDDGTKVKYKPKTSYDFEGANIDGIYNKPTGSYISNVKDVRARSIIRIRKDFDEEVADSARMLK